jgi:ubiquinone biosynthesis monooxygenase Coq7
MPRKSKPAAPGAPVDIEAMIRVDHAGEYGAVRIYEGQLAVLKRRKGAGRQCGDHSAYGGAGTAPSQGFRQAGE